MISAFPSKWFREIEEEQLTNTNDYVANGQLDETIEEFEKFLTEENEAKRYYSMGFRYLVNHKFGKAIKLNDMYAEAYKGLALAHKGKGNESEYIKYMNGAAEIYAQQNRLEEAKKAFIQILKEDPEAINPFNAMGINCHKKGDVARALHAYTQAIELTPFDENVYYNISIACVKNKNTKSTLQNIIKALELNSEFLKARKLYKKLASKDWAGHSQKGAQQRGGRQSTLLQDE